MIKCFELNYFIKRANFMLMEIKNINEKKLNYVELISIRFVFMYFVLLILRHAFF